jgi:hypothetical protein
MSDAKTPIKAETISKNSEATKAEVTKTEVVKTENKSADISADKSNSSPKSAAQSSISHFSSVSTPEYRSSWNKIFGGANDDKKTMPDEGRKADFPKNLEIFDDEIDVKLRSMLDAAFNDLAEKQGICSKGVKNPLRFRYNLSCEIKDM